MRNLPVALPALLAVLSAFETACSGDCTKEGRSPAYRVSVADAQTQRPICDANIPSAISSPNDCTFWDPMPSNQDSATIDVTREGYQSRSVVVSTHYDKDDCGKPVEVPVRIELTPVAAH